jgi:predicted RNA-binding Zn-ribbon protein involved in translation (DUF1610 family)
MTLSDGELKARWLAEAEAILDEVLKARQPDETLDDIEALATEARRRFGEQVTASLVGEYGKPSLEQVNCPSCGQALLYKGQKDKRLVTTSGEIIVRRAYYYCTSCRQGYFPPR